MSDLNHREYIGLFLSIPLFAFTFGMYHRLLTDVIIRKDPEIRIYKDRIVDFDKQTIYFSELLELENVLASAFQLPNIIAKMKSGDEIFIRIAPVSVDRSDISLTKKSDIYEAFKERWDKFKFELL